MKSILLKTEICTGIKNILDKKANYSAFKDLIYINKGCLYVTSGKIALKFENIETALSGVYKIFKIEKVNKIQSEIFVEIETQIQYPNIEQIFDLPKSEKEITLLTESSLSISAAIINIYSTFGLPMDYILLDKLSFVKNWYCSNPVKDILFVTNSNLYVSGVVLPFKM
jgi:hypothetical protein